MQGAKVESAAGAKEGKSQHVATSPELWKSQAYSEKKRGTLFRAQREREERFKNREKLTRTQAYSPWGEGRGGKLHFQGDQRGSNRKNDSP